MEFQCIGEDPRQLHSKRPTEDIESLSGTTACESFDSLFKKTDLIKCRGPPPSRTSQSPSCDDTACTFEPLMVEFVTSYKESDSSDPFYQLLDSREVLIPMCPHALFLRSLQESGVIVDIIQLKRVKDDSIYVTLLQQSGNIQRSICSLIILEWSALLETFGEELVKQVVPQWWLENMEMKLPNFFLGVNDDFIPLCTFGAISDGTLLKFDDLTSHELWLQIYGEHFITFLASNRCTPTLRIGEREMLRTLFPPKTAILYFSEWWLRTNPDIGKLSFEGKVHTNGKLYSEQRDCEVFLQWTKLDECTKKGWHARARDAEKEWNEAGAC